jgi:Carboxypeptidase regulatory-like domain
MVSGNLFRVALRGTALVITLGSTGPVRLLAQTGTSTIAGLVRDSSAATIPGAVVRVVNEDTRVSVEAVSDEHGSYRTAELMAGRYRLETALNGFETIVRRIVLEDGQTATIDVTLIPARITEGVIVTARPPGNSGLYVGLPGDPRTVGVTLRVAVRSRN